MQYIVSVCIPTYNGAKYLRECLDSVLAQTFSDFEIILVDDQSLDNTVQIANEYARKDARFRVVVNEQHLGLAGNWTRCVELSQGEWIKFVFQDDLIGPPCLERMVEFCQRDRGIIFSSRQFIFEEGTTEVNREYHISTLSVPNQLFAGKTNISGEEYCNALMGQIKAKKIYMNFIGEPPAVMLHKEAFARFGYFHPYLIQCCDIELWNRVAVNTGIIYIPEVLATFRIHNRSTSAINEKRHKFRAMELDQLIMLCDFAFHPVYAPLREVANRQKWGYLEDILKDKAYTVGRIAERALANDVDDGPSLRCEWDSLLKLYPILRQLSNRKFMTRVGKHVKYRWKQIRGKMVFQK